MPAQERSIYTRLIDDPSSIILPTGAETETAMPDIAVALLRMGGFKHTFVSPVFEAVLLGRTVRLEKERKETRNWPGKPELVALEKAQPHVLDIVTAAQELGFAPINEQMVLSVGQDVQLCDKFGNPIYKPSAETKGQALQQMQSVLCGQERSFRVKSGLAVFGKTSKTKGRGITFAQETRFQTTPFSKQELELYVYGLAGENNTYPDYLKEELLGLVEQELIAEDEVETYAQGLNLQEINQTSGGFRWPYPIFLRHVRKIDGIEKGQEGFQQKLFALFNTLIGAPPESTALLQTAVEKIKVPTIGQENWQRSVLLKDGTLAQVKSLQLNHKEDIVGTSSIICGNFQHHDHYAGLSPEAREEFCRVNSPEELADACSHPDNICATMIKQDGQIIGFCLVREAVRQRAEIRRLHTAIGYEGIGVGTFLIEDAVAVAASQGLSQIGAITSGEADEFFIGRGFQSNGRHKNAKLLERGVEAPVNYCVRKIA